MELLLHDFGHFKIYQPKDGYHFSYEPFILTMNLKSKSNKKIIDFGSGCGVIAVIVALQNPKSFVYAIEKYEKYIDIIKKNFRVNNIKNAKVLKQIDDIQINSIDYFITNPPYFTKDKFRPSKKYFNERFENEDLSQIILYAKRLLKNKGVLKLTFHPNRFIELVEILKINNFGIKTIQPAYGNVHKKASFVLVEARLASPSHVEFKPPVILDSYTI